MILIEIDFAGASIFVSVILPSVSSDRYLGRSLIFVLVLLILLLLARAYEGVERLRMRGRHRAAAVARCARAANGGRRRVCVV